MSFNKHTVYFSSFTFIASIVILLNFFLELDFSVKDIFMISISYSTTVYSVFAVIYKFTIYNQCDPVFDKYANIKNNATRIGMMLVMFVVSYILTKDVFDL